MVPYFDGCTEVILEQFLGQEPEKLKGWKDIYDYLPKLFEECVKQGVFPAGEIRRAFACRQYLRGAMHQLANKLNGIDEDEIVKDVVRRTQAFIEEVGEETECQRAYTVVRNLCILCENMANMEPGKGLPLPVGPQPKLTLQVYRISPKGIAVFRSLINQPEVSDPKALLTPPRLTLIQPKQIIEGRYRSIFFETIIQSVVVKEGNSVEQL